MTPALILLNVLLFGALIGAVVLLGLHRRASRPKSRPLEARPHIADQPAADVPVAAVSPDDAVDDDAADDELGESALEVVDDEVAAEPDLVALASDLGAASHAPGDALNLIFADQGPGDAARRTLGALTGIGFAARWGLEHELLLSRPQPKVRRRRKAQTAGRGDLVRMIVGRANDRDAQITLDVVTGNPAELAAQMRGQLYPVGADLESEIIDDPDGAVELSIVRRAPFYFSAA